MKMSDPEEIGARLLEREQRKAEERYRWQKAKVRKAVEERERQRIEEAKKRKWVLLFFPIFIMLWVVGWTFSWVTDKKRNRQ
jgi:hypothetical protein